MAYNCIPGGLETDSEDDDELMFAGDIEKPKKLTLWDFMKDGPKHDYVDVDWSTAVEVKTPRKGLIMLESNDELKDLKDSLVFLDKIRVSAVNGNLEYIKEYLPKVGIDVKLKNDWSCLQWAAAHAQPSVVQFCLENGADPNQHKCHTTPLMNAVLAPTYTSDVNGCKEKDIIACVDSLLKYGANVNERDIVGTTALAFAVKKNRSAVVTALIDNGADIDRGDQFRYAPMHVAAAFGQGAMIELLIRRGAKFNVINVDEETIANVAFKRDHEELGHILDDLIETGVLSDDISIQLKKFKPFVHSEWTNDEITPCANVDETDLSDSRLPMHQLVKECETKSNNCDSNNGDIEERLYEAHLTDFLHAHGLRDLEPIFKSKSLNFLDILFLDDSDFEEIGLSPKDRRKMISAVKSFHQTPWSKMSLPNLRGQVCDHFEVANFIAHVTSQLSYTQASFDYLKREISKELSDQEEFSNKKEELLKLIWEVDECLDEVESVDEAICDFDRTLDQFKVGGIHQEVNMITPDLIKDIVKRVPNHFVDEDDFDNESNWFPKAMIILASISFVSLIALKMITK